MKFLKKLLSLVGGDVIARSFFFRIKHEVINAILGNRQNIELARELTALFETASFVDREMNHVASTSDPLVLMKHSLEAVTNSGLYLEFGVFRGASINFISERTHETVYGFDSFEGLPEFWRDHLEQGTFAVKELPQVNPNVRLVKGWFSETLPTFLQEHSENFAFVHIDCDLHSSTATIFALAESRFQTGTVIVFDEYFNYPGWKYGEYLAFMEFIAKTKFAFEYLGYCRFNQQVAVRLKNKTQS